MGDSLQPSELFGRTASCTNVVSVMQVELWLVKLCTALEFHCFGFFRIREVELNNHWVILD